MTSTVVVVVALVLVATVRAIGTLNAQGVGVNPGNHGDRIGRIFAF
jgi:hypothetical protein